MILQALYEYYQKKDDIAPEGLEKKGIPFIIVIDSLGHFVRLEDTREGEGRGKQAKVFLVPRGENRAGPSAWKVAYLLWDHLGYVLGQARSETNSDKELARKQHESFVNLIQNLPKGIKESSHISPVVKFYENHEEDKVIQSEGFEECVKIAGCNLMFRIEGDFKMPTEDPVIINHSRNFDSAMGESGNEEDGAIEGVEGICSVTGERGPIARKHSRTPINKDTKSLVAIQRNSGYDSYGKEQAYNCSVGKKAEFFYTTALNALLNSEPNRIQFGNDKLVFWAQKSDSIFQKNVKSFFFSSGKKKDDPDQGVADAKSSLQAILSGIPPDELPTRFYILGLSPNSARIAVRYWHQDTIGSFCSHMQQHFQDLEVTAPSFDVCRLSLQYLLGSLIRDRAKPEDLPPHLMGEMMSAVIEGLPYPETMLHQCMRRIRAEHFDDSHPSKYDPEGRIRAAILKAYINRKSRLTNTKNEKEITVALDPDNLNQGYRLGRLFAVLEKIQEDANPGIKATIRDRFYGAASTSPISVFPLILNKLTPHHLSKLKAERPGLQIFDEKWLTEIMAGVPIDWSSHLAMDDQARFAVGYYHQRQALFGSNKDSSGNK